jgi:starvation-inducible DNA-binding protein
MKIDIGLKDNSRKTVADALAGVLADTYTLYLKTHNFHWNVTGPEFPYLHTMFETQYNELWTAVDELAERIRALGFPAPGSYSQFAALTQIKESTKPPAAKEMLKQLLADNETVVRRLREANELCEEAGDVDTGDILVGRMQVHAKAAWMLRAQLE